jgi:hypothetical protein
MSREQVEERKSTSKYLQLHHHALAWAEADVRPGGVRLEVRAPGVEVPVRAVRAVRTPPAVVVRCVERREVGAAP